MRRKATADFKQRFRGADVVLIDDVQFLAGRDKTREEFFHTFNSLIDAGRQLVMTSDRAPEDIPGIEARLIERFRSGLVAEVDTPELEVRMAILAKRARLDGVEVDNDVLVEIAGRVTTSVRALEGALIRVVAYASLSDEPPRRRWRATCCAGSARTRRRTPASVNEILEATAQEFGVPLEELKGESRRRAVAGRATWPCTSPRS